MIVVVGSCNIDLITYTSKLPKLGETLKGNNFKKGFGGKGANQAIACSRLGEKVYIVGKLGNDSNGKETIQNFLENQVDTSYLYTIEEKNIPSGVATIIVDNEGNNCIIIVNGANDYLTKEDIENASDIISKSKYLICQLEIPENITLEAMRIAKKYNVKTILNPAPAQKNLSQELFQLCDILCPNETELEILSGKSITNLQEVIDAAQCLLKKGLKTIIVTLGAQGCILVTENTIHHCPIKKKVKAIDTTGAGDCFIGSLVFYLSKGKSMIEAMEFANYISGISVQHEGTQTSYPWKKDLPYELFY